MLYGHFGSCSATSKVVRGTERIHNFIANSCPVSGNTNTQQEISGDKKKLTQL